MNTSMAIDGNKVRQTVLYEHNVDSLSVSSDSNTNQIVDQHETIKVKSSVVHKKSEIIKSSLVHKESEIVESSLVHKESEILKSSLVHKESEIVSSRMLNSDNKLCTTNQQEVIFHSNSHSDSLVSTSSDDSSQGFWVHPHGSSNDGHLDSQHNSSNDSQHGGSNDDQHNSSNDCGDIPIVTEANNNNNSLTMDYYNSHHQNLQVETTSSHNKVTNSKVTSHGVLLKYEDESRGIVPKYPRPKRGNAVIDMLCKLWCDDKEKDPHKQQLLFHAMKKVVWSFMASHRCPINHIGEQHIKMLKSLLEHAHSILSLGNHQAAIPLTFASAAAATNTSQDLVRHHQLLSLTSCRFLNEFNKERTLGSGGFAVVVQARNIIDKCVYAIKIVPIKKWSSCDGLTREAQALARLDHPNIIRYYTTWIQPYDISQHASVKELTSSSCSSINSNESSSEFQGNSFDAASGNLDPDDSLSQCQSDVRLVNVGPVKEEHSGASIMFKNSSQNSSYYQTKTSKTKTDSSNSIIFEEGSGGSSYAQQMSSSRQTATSKTNTDSSNSIVFGSSYAQQMSSPRQTATSKTNTDSNNSIVFKEGSGSSSSYPNEMSSSRQTNTTKAKADSSNSIIFGQGSYGEIKSYKSRTSKLKCKKFVQKHRYDQKTSKETSSLFSDKMVPHFPSIKILPQRYALFIQMALCGESLTEFLQKRNSNSACALESTLWYPVNVTKYLQIFHDIVSAVDYIHHIGIIHRDIKPGNILLSLDKKKALLGDFGLISDDYVESTNSNADHTKLKTVGVGTPPYAAPELLAGDMYDNKSDMFGLGIVLLELFQCFTTTSEKFHCIDQLKSKRKLDDHFFNQFSQLRELILSLTEPGPDDRPSAANVLDQAISFNTLKKHNDSASNIGLWQSVLQMKRDLLKPFDLPLTSQQLAAARNLKYFDDSAIKYKNYGNLFDSNKLQSTNLITKNIEYLKMFPKTASLQNRHPDIFSKFDSIKNVTSNENNNPKTELNKLFEIYGYSTDINGTKYNKPRTKLDQLLENEDYNTDINKTEYNKPKTKLDQLLQNEDYNTDINKTEYNKPNIELNKSRSQYLEHFSLSKNIFNPQTNNINPKIRKMNSKDEEEELQHLIKEKMLLENKLKDVDKRIQELCS